MRMRVVIGGNGSDVLFVADHSWISREVRRVWMEWLKGVLGSSTLLVLL